MHILIVTNYYPPEIGGSAHLCFELAQSMTARGHEVTVLTGFPRYNVVEDLSPRYRRGLWLDEASNGVRVRRIRIPSLPRENKIARGVEHLLIGLWLGGLTSLAGRADVALVDSPPLPLAWMVSLAGRLRRLPVLVYLEDLFPHDAVQLGVLTNPMLIRLFEGMERHMFRLASAAAVHSPGNKTYVVQHGGQPDRVHVVYLWVDTDRIRPGERDNEFAGRHGLADRFVVSYAGTMGWAQDMETIIDGADRLRDHPEILFLLVGDGVEKEQVMARSDELGLDNILWLPMQPWAVYPEVLAASDVSMINLHPDLHTPVVPSKLFSIMAAARPVVASLPEISDARQVVAEAECGICVGAGDGEALAGAILDLYSDRALGRDMGRRGRAYAEAHFSRQACTRKMETIFEEVAGDRL